MTHETVRFRSLPCGCKLCGCLCLDHARGQRPACIVHAAKIESCFLDREAGPLPILLVLGLVCLALTAWFA